MTRQQLIKDIFRAYYDARRNKRNKKDVIEFEMNYERNLFVLADDISLGRYQLGASVCFIVDRPVKREIFAASFRDRIVHHLIYNYINPIIERKFINDSYSCRINKGTSYGIRRLDHFIRSCSENYKKDCYILKLDIKGYFMSINKEILFNKIVKTLSLARERESNFPACKSIKLDYEFIANLIKKIIFYDPIENYIIKGNRRDWNGLPKSKSLFFTKSGCGLPIGNLTSQLFSNVYLDDFDHFIKRQLGCKYYGRYVDDFVIVHQDKEYLKSIIPVLRRYLKENLGLELHDKKIYLQHFSKGVDFLGTIIKPYRIYIKNQTKGNFYRKIDFWNSYSARNENKLSREDVRQLASSVNSYLGIMKHYKTYKIRRKLLDQKLSKKFNKYIQICNDYTKIRLKKRD